ncbi:uncharacterized protein LOC113662223 [Tachysurus fulvidraco]|uniref:uncharacterized protein LOC113662223 n=1 Tax=Tachysurus fulvidraco TaxID=1234273 RepID=UPI001FEE44B9|nr:uncharacterized protein LOC113662223 [Tachysurus fulvidraco]XP_047656268.1 uncharacterized protein LOC113662223 [Tachysurus fulvidraco]
MAFQIWSIPVPISVPVEVKPRETHPLIQCIVDNKANKLKNRVSKSNINGLYSSATWKDDVSLLTAAVACGNEEICEFLLIEKADPNILSTNCLTSLHYAANNQGVPLNIVRRLIAAKANPDGHQQQAYTPLQLAASKDRLDVIEALIKAGANPERNYGKGFLDLDEKVENLINRLHAGNEAVEKCKMFFTFATMVPRKTQTEVFNFCREKFFEEHPCTHMLLFERYFNVVKSAELYQESSTKWLKDSKKTEIYINGFIERFPRIPDEHRIMPLNSLHAVICMMGEISPQIFNTIVPILIKCLVPTTVQGNMFNHLILSILYVIMDKSSKQKPAAESLHSDVLEKLCDALMPLTNPNNLTDVRIYTYRLFADLHKFVPEHINSCGVTSVPERVLHAVDIGPDDALKEKLHKLDTNLRNPQNSNTVDCMGDAADSMPSKKKKKKKKKKKDNQQSTISKEDSDTAKTSVQESSVHPYATHTEDLPVKRNWLSLSQRWKPKLEKLANLPASKVYRLGNLTIGNSSEFEIAKGSDGTRVFLGLRDDGTEIAVKRMYRSEYQDLKNEEQFLRLPQLDNPCIVRYVDFAEDEHFGYLALQLCEYTLKEYIEDHLPEDTSQQLQVLKKIVKEVLYSLNALHGHDTKVLHRDIKPQNVLIDITGKARLADFGISRRLKLGETTCRTNPAGTRYWKARETLEEDCNSGYKRSSDIQVAGMLIYYILSRGQHPFGTGARCESNILDGKYSLEHVEDELAKDLVKWMISYEPKDRPNVEETLRHPFFWTNKDKLDYLNKLGNEKEVDNCRNAGPELLLAIEAVTAGKSFTDWKTKLPAELLQKLDGKKKPYPENTLGLLRFIRNLHQHYSGDAKNLDLMMLFPDLFETAFMFAKTRGWTTAMEFMTEIPAT